MAQIRYARQADGPILGYTFAKIIKQDGHVFKDLNRDGLLEPYEDWRLSPEARAEDLAGRLSIEQIAGLMLYSAHQSVPDLGMGFFRQATYGGKPFKESGAKPWSLSDQQMQFLRRDGVRHVLTTVYQSPAVAARWNNHMQAYCEGLDFGIPVNVSSDPRHGSDFSSEYSLGAGGTISHWPESLGLAATFDPALVRQFGEIASKEYRALGITTALSPQIDLASEPRWVRFTGTFGEGTKLVTDLARAYCDGFQSTGKGWGMDSVNAMVKHWPGGGSGEAGRDAHYAYGKYAVYPGGNMEEHKIPFLEGAFKLAGGTEKAAAVMPYYTISAGVDAVGNGYSHALIAEQLREKYGYDGVVCTDWGVTGDEGMAMEQFAGKCWGMEKESLAERHLRVLMAGGDQFGGNNDAAPILEAYRLGLERYGQEAMDGRFRQAACRLLVNIFRVGLFENPYLDVDETIDTVACEDFVHAGYLAQLRSLILLKNHGNVLPIKGKKKVYVPEMYRPASVNFFGLPVDEKRESPIPLEAVKKYFTVVDDPREADFALCVIASPISGSGYDPKDRAAGGSGYVPISLQYRPYTARTARAHSLCGGDPLEDFTDRSYRNKTVTTANESDLEMVLSAREAMGDKPVIVALRLDKPCVVGEFEPAADAIVAHSGVEAEALLDVLSGAFEPQGLLPMQLPRDMETVEAQLEDVPLDMEPHVDADGNRYDFAYGRDWRGKIEDERVKKYACGK